MIVTIVVYLLQLGIPSLTGHIEFSRAQFMQQPWTIVTAIFAHDPADIFHILFNMWALFVFGSIIEPMIGEKKFILIYLATGILANVAFALYYPPAVTGLGASAAIFGIIGTLIMLAPNLPLMLFFFIPMPLWMAGIFWALLDIIGLLSPGPIANIAHLAGLGLGLLIGFMLKKNTEEVESAAIAYSRSKGYY